MFSSLMTNKCSTSGTFGKDYKPRLFEVTMYVNFKENAFKMGFVSYCRILCFMHIAMVKPSPHFALSDFQLKYTTS